MNVGIAITNFIKLAGLGLGLVSPHGALSTHPQAAIIALAGFMMAGAEVSEKTLSSMLDRFIPRVNKEDSASSPHATSSEEEKLEN